MKNSPESFAIRFEDEDLAVVSKQAGVVVHPGAGDTGRTLVEALASTMRLAEGAGKGRPGIVHRLDKQTSGLMVVAKTDRAFVELTAQIASRSVKRSYLALASGRFKMPTGRIEAPIQRSSRQRSSRAVNPEGKPSITLFDVRETLGEASLLKVRLLTGRTHQIRVHLAHIKHPVVGDPTYGKRTLALASEIGLERQFLHAACLAFVHPVSGEEVEFDEDLPSDLESALARLRHRVAYPSSAEAGV